MKLLLIVQIVQGRDLVGVVKETMPANEALCGMLNIVWLS
jgi:hypothetical protein